MSLQAMATILKKRTGFIAWITVALVLAALAYTLTSAGGVRASFSVLVTRTASKPASANPALNPFEADYDTYYSLRAAELATTMLSQFLADPVFVKSIPYHGSINTRIFGSQYFKVYFIAPNTKAARSDKTAIITALNARLAKLGGNGTGAAFSVRAEDFASEPNTPHYAYVLAAFIMGLVASGAWVLFRAAGRDKR